MKNNENTTLELSREPLSSSKRGSIELKRGSFELERGSLDLKRGSVALERASLELKRGSLELPEGPSDQAKSIILNQKTEIVFQFVCPGAESEAELWW